MSHAILYMFTSKILHVFFLREEVRQPNKKVNWPGSYFFIGPGEARTDNQKGHLGWLLELFVKPPVLLLQEHWGLDFPIT